MKQRVIIFISLFLIATPLLAAMVDPRPAFQIWSHYCSDSNLAYPKACRAYRQHPPRSAKEAHRFLTRYWHRSLPTNVLLTGYYTPTYSANYFRDAVHNSPLYGRPPRKAKPCSRERINHQQCKKLGPVLAWMNRIDRFFLQIQGSGLLQFPDDHSRQVAYAGRNGFPYVAIGRWMLRTHRLERPISMQSIRHYLQRHPKEVDHILNQDPAFIYCRWQTPMRITGASGHTLTPAYSVAVDPKRIRYGQLIELSGIPGENAHTMVVTEDTGSAIRGRHLDLYLGQGSKAAEQAGHLQAHVVRYVWLPK